MAFGALGLPALCVKVILKAHQHMTATALNGTTRTVDAAPAGNLSASASSFEAATTAKATLEAKPDRLSNAAQFAVGGIVMANLASASESSVASLGLKSLNPANVDWSSLPTGPLSLDSDIVPIERSKQIDKGLANPVVSAEDAQKIAGFSVETGPYPSLDAAAMQAARNIDSLKISKQTSKMLGLEFGYQMDEMPGGFKLGVIVQGEPRSVRSGRSLKSHTATTFHNHPSAELNYKGAPVNGASPADMNALFRSKARNGVRTSYILASNRGDVYRITYKVPPDQGDIKNPTSGWLKAETTAGRLRVDLVGNTRGLPPPVGNAAAFAIQGRDGQFLVTPGDG